MVHLENKDFRVHILADILKLNYTDFKFVAKDGVFRTQKLLIFSVFPVLRGCFEDCNECCEELTMMLPEEPVERIQKSIVKMVIEGDISCLENIVGFKSSILGDSERSIINKSTSSIDRSNARKRNKQIPVIDSIQVALSNDIQEDEEDPLMEEITVKEEMYLQNDEGYLPPPKKRNIKLNYCCPECGKRFRDNFHLNRHIQSGHIIGVKCERCNEKFQGRKEYNVHQRNCWMRCELCDWVTKKMGERVNGHKRRHAKEGESNCTFVCEQLDEEEVEAFKKSCNEYNWKNKDKEEPQYTERITYVYKYSNDAHDSD